jgi:uncharacterized protein Smg (DUF494 family)
MVMDCLTMLDKPFIGLDYLKWVALTVLFNISGSKRFMRKWKI